MDERSKDRLEELELLEPGWLDGTGQPVHPRVIELATQVLTDVSRSPSIYPTPAGGIEIVWGLGMFELTIDPDGAHTLHMYSDFLFGDKDEYE